MASLIEDSSAIVRRDARRRRMRSMAALTRDAGRVTGLLLASILVNLLMVLLVVVGLVAVGYFAAVTALAFFG